jgi:hypothetical protein
LAIIFGKQVELAEHGLFEHGSNVSHLKKEIKNLKIGYFETIELNLLVYLDLAKKKAKQI